MTQISLMRFRKVVSHVKIIEDSLLVIPTKQKEERVEIAYSAHIFWNNKSRSCKSAQWR